MIRKTKDAREPSLEPTDPRVKKINAALADMKAAFEKRKADPDSILIELTGYAGRELEKVPELKVGHRFSSVKGLIERRILPREEV